MMMMSAFNLYPHDRNYAVFLIHRYDDESSQPLASRGPVRSGKFRVCGKFRHSSWSVGGGVSPVLFVIKLRPHGKFRHSSWCRVCPGKVVENSDTVHGQRAKSSPVLFVVKLRPQLGARRRGVRIQSSSQWKIPRVWKIPTQFMVSGRSPVQFCLSSNYGGLASRPITAPHLIT